MKHSPLGGEQRHHWFLTDRIFLKWNRMAGTRPRDYPGLVELFREDFLESVRLKGSIPHKHGPCA